MSKVPAWHSIRHSDPEVYHDNTKCTEGNNIEVYNRVPGTGNRDKCDHCKRLD